MTEKEKVKCMDGKCEFEHEECCRDCEKAETCKEVCDGMDAKGLQKPCDWRAEEC